MVQRKYLSTLSATRMMVILLFALGIAGCTDITGGRDASDDGVGRMVDSTGTSRQLDADTAGDMTWSELQSVLQHGNFKGAVEECCTNVGKLDECWWEDAIADGVTCSRHSDCESGECVFDYDRPGATSNVGLCRCNPNVASHCNDDLAGRHGVCVKDPDLGYHVCGPSYCNGYLKCSCFGGCEWWRPEQPGVTPQDLLDSDQDAIDNRYVCCEGTYPLGGADIITYTGIGNCELPTALECEDATDCDDNNPCTSEACLAEGRCQYSPVTDGTACSVDTDTSDCLGARICESGVCGVTLLAEGTTCGAGTDTVPDDCITGFECDHLGRCIEAHEPAATPCELDTAIFEPSCWSGFCGMVDDSTWPPVAALDTDSATPIGDDGLCWNVRHTSAANDTCADAVQLGGGTIANTVEGVVATVTGSTDCAVNDYSAGHRSCVENDGVTPIGSMGGDVVYYFDYEATDSTQQDLFAFVITVESDLDAGTLEDDFRAVVYTSNDSCDAAASNPCLYQPDDEGSVNPPPVPWEYRANTAGRDWGLESQVCGPDDYAWCSRTFGAGTWTYPSSPTPCVFAADGSYHCASTAGHVAQTVVYPRNDQSATPHRVYVFVDGARGDRGTFRLTLSRLLWNNGACERVTDAPRVYDITEVPTAGNAVVQGNLKDYANSDHSAATTDCGGYDCTADWRGWTRAHGGSFSDANPFWPNAAYFRIQPSTDTTYCLRTDQTGLSGAISPVIEVRRLLQQRDLCQSAYTQVDARAGDAGLDFVALASQTYLVLVSEEGPNAETNGPCSGDCNYRLLVSQGPCTPPPCAASTYQVEAPPVTTSGGLSVPPSWCLDENGSVAVTHTFSGESVVEVLARGSYGFDSDSDGQWPHMLVAIDGDTANPVLDTYLNGDTDELYTAAFGALTGDHTVSVHYDNDADFSGDRNLYLDWLRLTCAEPDTDTDTGVLPDTDTQPANCQDIVFDNSGTTSFSVVNNDCFNLIPTGAAGFQSVDLRLVDGTVDSANNRIFATWGWNDGTDGTDGSFTFTHLWGGGVRLTPWDSASSISVNFHGNGNNVVTVRVSPSNG